MVEESEWDALVREVNEAIATRKHKRENPYVVDLIEALRGHAGGRERQQVIADIERRRRAKKLPIPKTLGEVVQSAFQGHCSQYAAYRGTSAADDLFYTQRVGSGIWAVRADRAEAWLKARRA